MAVTTAILTLALTAAATVVQVSGQMSQGRMAASAADMQAKQLGMQSAQQANQARQQNIQGDLAMAEAQQQAAFLQQEGTRTRARQVAQAASAGLSLDSGSFLDVAADTANQFELDREQILRSGRMNQAAIRAGAAGGFIDAAGTAASSSIVRNEGAARKSASMYNAGASIFSGMEKSVGVAQKAGWFD